ncbi:glycosyltransferase [Paenibacillus sp. 2003]|uniref:glycosyltransferase n=1 Tax=Paenibacillus TaxID=44249 RepID=UPI002854D866|nr:glycosyltransferase [Paenibacillus sp. 2003]MDR6720294.1 glycosyltransferase involved in cell wall biosynthesis [Paenibacillus sp. 2003]
MSKTIALCMIVKNEEQFLRRCLDSVKDKVDQIVIVDTGSTDSTLSIAKEYTKDIVHMEWTNDFSVARNESIRHANTDYILVLDADEYLEQTTNLAEELQSGADYYFTKIFNLMSGDRGMNHLAIRIFKNKIGLCYQNRLHEHLNTREQEDQLVAGYSNLTIMHTGYIDEIMEGRGKAQRNLALMLVEVKENPSVYNLFNMGRTYMWLGEHEKAIKYLQKAYPLSKNLTIAPELIASLCRSLSELNRYEEALTVLEQAVDIYPLEVDLFHLQALCYMEIGYHRDALACMNRCLEIGDQGISFTEGNGTYIAHLRLAEWHTTQNEYNKAYEHITEAIKFKEGFLPVIGKYFEIVEKAGLSLDEMFTSANDLFSITNSRMLEKILEALYQLRHPLLQRYLTLYEVTVQKHVMAVASQYAKDYSQAREQWLVLPEQEEQNGVDILLLAILLKDEVLFKKAGPLLNLSEKEKKFLAIVVRNEAIDKLSLTTYTECILERVLVHLIRLQEFEVMETILGYMWHGHVEIKIKVCQHLADYGFGEIAIDLLLELFKLHPRNKNIIELLGDVCYRSNYLQDAQLFYSELLELYDNYSSHERMYNVYLKSNDETETNALLTVISEKFKLCLWVR